MKKLLVIILTFVLAAPLLTACGEGNGGSNPPAQQGDQQTPIEVVDGGEWFRDTYWSLDVTVDQQLEVGELYGVPGMYMNFHFDINMIKQISADDEFWDEDITGEYLLSVDSTVTENSDEAVDQLLSEALGGDVSGLEFGLNVYDEGHYSTTGYLDEDENYVYVGGAFVQNASNNWVSYIKDKNLKSVQPPVGSYLMFHQFTMEYTSEMAGIYGYASAIEEIPIYLFIVIEPDSPGVDMEIDRKVKVYMTFPDWNLAGKPVWLEGEGTLSMRQYYSHSEQND